MAPEESKFLKLIEENTPEDRTPAEKAKVYLTSILKNAGYKADYKTFADEVTITFGDGDTAVFEVKKVIPAEAEEHHPVEDAETNPALSRANNRSVEQIGALGDAMKAAEAVVGANDPRRGMRLQNPKKKLERSIGGVYSKIADKLNKIVDSI